MSTKITPTVGRVVWFYPAANQQSADFSPPAAGQPLAAIVAAVKSEEVVNLTVFDAMGFAHARINVPLLQEGQETREGGFYATWMPYQVNQAKKHAEREVQEIPITTADKYRMRLDDIGRVCHEVNRAYCQALGDDSQPTWEDAPTWQRESARMGVDLHMSGNFGPEASHISWMNQKLAEGWAYGPVKNPDLKQHPCLVPFDQLPREQQAKDYLFRAVVHALR